MMDGQYGEQFGPHHGFHWGIVVMLAAIIALVAITVLVIRGLDRARTGGSATTRPSASGGGAGSTAAEVLQVRLAKGEISVEEYRERMSALVEIT
jgi:uncharacterized membrane protein